MPSSFFSLTRFALVITKALALSRLDKGSLNKPKGKHLLSPKGLNGSIATKFIVGTTFLC